MRGYVNCGGSVLKKQDFFEGEIKKGPKVVSKIEGSYMGHCDFDGVRYWDIRDEKQTQKMFKLNYLEPNPLPSDSTKRLDRQKLVEGDYDTAQAEKETLEELQRHDRALREKCDQRRADGGPKFATS